MGLRTVFTDHSLFAFDDLASISINKVLKWVLANVDAAITVSHANKDNLTLRAALNP
jgi:phosphatidylinositol glycan class A protein